MLDELLAHYDATFVAAMRATAALDELVLTLNPQPTALITLRAAAPLTVPWLPHAPAAITPGLPNNWHQDESNRPSATAASVSPRCWPAPPTSTMPQKC